VNCVALFGDHGRTTAAETVETTTANFAIRDSRFGVGFVLLYNKCEYVRGMTGKIRAWEDAQEPLISCVYLIYF
jgi:hypothetical protein